MFALVFFCFLQQNEVQFKKSIVVETNARMLFGVSSEKIAMGLDGSYVIATEHEVWHFNSDGTVRLRFGRKGEGPCEFQHIYAQTWDGEYYWVVDGMRLETSQIDNMGKLVKRHRVFYNDLFYQGGKMIATMGGSIRQLARERPLMLYSVDPSKGLKKAGKPFHKLSEEAVDLFYNYTHHFVAISDSIFVVDQVNPTVFAYDKSSQKLKSKIKLDLPGFVFSPKEFFQVPSKLGRPMDHRKFAQWEDSWSRITGFSVADGNFVLTYCRPSIEEDSKTTILCETNEQGKVLKVSPINGELIGVHSGVISIFSEWDDNESNIPKYKIYDYVK